MPRTGVAIMHFSGIGSAFHRKLGPVRVTPGCAALQATNPDSTTIFVESMGEIVEVSRGQLLSIDPMRDKPRPSQAAAQRLGCGAA